MQTSNKMKGERSSINRQSILPTNKYLLFPLHLSSLSFHLKIRRLEYKKFTSSIKISLIMRLVLCPLLLAGLSVCSALLLQARADFRKRAAYILSNNLEGNKILALSISNVDGTVSEPVLTLTGGNGLLGLTVDGSVGPDGLFSQGAVAVSQDVSITRFGTICEVE